MSLMSVVVPIDQAGALPARTVGGKARYLGRMRTAGLPVSNGLVLTTEAYRHFIDTSGLSDWIGMTLCRLSADPTPEELGDVSLAIHARFMRQEWPAELMEVLADRLEPFAIEGPVAVRSSTPFEDGCSNWMSGLHESFIGVEGVDSMLAAVVGVWASTFSECALGYSLREGLDPLAAEMAVIVHPLLLAETSGIVITENHHDPGTGTVEAVWGLGQGIVGGGIEPDRWLVERPSGHILDHTEPIRELHSVAAIDGTELVALDPRRRSEPPLTPAQLADVWRLAGEVEALFGVAQECEWVLDDHGLVLLQARPVAHRSSILRATGCDGRVADDALIRLRRRIEEEFLPAMRLEADALAAVRLAECTDAELMDEARRRSESLAHWRLVSRAAMQPFTQGVRSFGRYHARIMRPDDPLDFTRLLVRTPLEYAERQSLLAALGTSVPEPPTMGGDRAAAEHEFLASVPFDRREEAAEMLQLGRSSWSLCDNHALYMLRIEREAARCADELGRRLAIGESSERDAMHRAAADLEAASEASCRDDLDAPVPEPTSVARQLIGTPASAGLARGVSRVVELGTRMTGAPREGVLVVDALPANEVSLADGAIAIVEARGGAFTHGAIHAREHGIPCVTGCAGVVGRIPDGATVTVDGYLGVVVVENT
jgi:pyruvate,water dikinase